MTTAESYMPTPRHPDGSPRVEHAEIDRYRTRNEGVTPYPARVGDKVFVFDKRPPASLQMKAFNMFAGRDEASQLNAEDMVVVIEMLRVMISEPSKLDELMDLVDLPELSNIMGKAMEKVSERPTTGSPDSGASAPPTTSGTGSFVPESNSQISTHSH